MANMTITELEAASFKPLIKGKISRQIGTIDSIINDAENGKTIVKLKCALTGYPFNLFYEDEQFELFDMSG